MSVYSCGWAKGGQLGIGPCPTDVVKDPMLIEGLKGKNIVRVACGDQSSFAIADLGDVWCWGRGIEGQLGQGNRLNQLAPVRIDALQHEKVVKIACGNHCIALTATGRVYIWGRLFADEEVKEDESISRLAGMTGLKKNTVGDLVEKSINKYLSAGNTEEEKFHTYTAIKNYYQTLPRLVVELENEVVVDIAAGYSFSMAVTQTGKVYSWGFNDKSQLGLGHRYNRQSPVIIPTLIDERVVSIYCGQQHTLALTDKGVVWSWGLGVFGQLGHSNAKDSLVPKAIEYFIDNNVKVKKLSCGAHHSVALTEDGKVYSWGHGEYGQHGGTTEYVDWGTGSAGGKENHHSVPSLLSGLEGLFIVDVSCGHLHNCAITADGEAFTWGWGASGCLGHGNTRFQLIPKQVGALTGERITNAACSWKHTLFLKEGGEATFAFDYESLIDNDHFSDVHFEVQGKLIFAHKVIIFARSEHLRAMIEMSERFCNNRPKNGVVTIRINRVLYPVFLGLIRYLYTDHLKLPPHHIEKLGELAVVYRIPRLAAICKRACYVNAKVGVEGNFSFEIPHSEFSTQLKTVVNTRKFADMRFVLTGNVVFPAHKALLTRRCSYFASMLSSGFQESSESELVINVDDNINEDVFLAFIEYLYSGDASTITPENVVDMIAVADRFMVEELKQVAESIIVESIDEDNVCYLLEIADRFNVPRLKRSSIEYITSSQDVLNIVKQSPGFAHLSCSSHTLMRELDFNCSKRKLGRIFSQPTVV